MSRVQELREKHGTPQEFSNAVRLACDHLFITPAEAQRAIEVYMLEYYVAARHDVAAGLFPPESPL